jgi:glycosyltransferase involved in cell wall biosynthesis
MATAGDPNNEAISVLIPVRDAGATLTRAITAWCDALAKLGHDWELILIDDASGDDTGIKASELASKRSQVRVLTHEIPRGFGACLRTALAEAKHPLIFYTALDYPYNPADLRNLVARLEQSDDFFQRPLDLVTGCRTGRPAPLAWRVVGALYRLFCRIALGLPLQPAPGWLGFRNHFRSWWAWPVFGIPVVDTNSAFKLFRRVLLDRFPIQSDGGFVHAELLAKCTFLSSKGHEILMDELPLSPRPEPIPHVEWSEMGKVLANAMFHVPASLLPPTPEEKAPLDEGNEQPGSNGNQLSLGEAI